MKRILYVLQIILKCLLVFFISFIWLKYILDSTWLSIAIASALTAIIELVTLAISRKTRQKSNLKLKEKEDAENMFLSILTDKSHLNFFHQLTASRYNCEQKKRYILINHPDSKVILFPVLKIAKLTSDDILTVYKSCNKESPNKIVILCGDYEKDCPIFIRNLSQQIMLLDKFETYALLYKEYDFYPEVTVEYKKDAKLKFKDLISFSFNKSRTKGYLISALVLILPSIFIKTNMYYCIVATLLLVFALVSFINPKYNVKKEQSIL